MVFGEFFRPQGLIIIKHSETNWVGTCSILSPQRCGLDGVDGVREVDAKKVACNKVQCHFRDQVGGIFFRVWNMPQITLNRPYSDIARLGTVAESCNVVFEFLSIS